MIVYVLCSQQSSETHIWDLYLAKELAEEQRLLMAAKWKHEEWFLKEYKVIDG